MMLYSYGAGGGLGLQRRNQGAQAPEPQIDAEASLLLGGNVSLTNSLQETSNHMKVIIQHAQS